MTCSNVDALLAVRKRGDDASDQGLGRDSSASISISMKMVPTCSDCFDLAYDRDPLLRLVAFPIRPLPPANNQRCLHQAAAALTRQYSADQLDTTHDRRLNRYGSISLRSLVSPLPLSRHQESSFRSNMLWRLFPGVRLAWGSKVGDKGIYR